MRRPPTLWFAGVAGGRIAQVGAYLKPVLGNPQVEDGQHDGRVAARRAHNRRKLSNLRQLNVSKIDIGPQEVDIKHCGHWVVRKLALQGLIGLSIVVIHRFIQITTFSK